MSSSMYACLYQPPAPDSHCADSACGHAPHASDSEAWEASARGGGAPRERMGVGPHAPKEKLDAIAQNFSPRYECHGDDLITIDISGLDRLLGPSRVVGEELRRACADRGLRAHVAIASTWTAAAILAHARAGLTVVPRGDEAGALAPIALGVLEVVRAELARPVGDADGRSELRPYTRWGIRTLGELAALPSTELAAP